MGSSELAEVVRRAFEVLEMAHFQSCVGNSAYLAAFRSWTRSAKSNGVPLNIHNEAGYFGRVTKPGRDRPVSFNMLTGYLLNSFTLTAIMGEGILVGREGGPMRRLPWHCMVMSGGWEDLFKIIRRDQIEAWEVFLQCTGLATATTFTEAPAASPASTATLTCQCLLGEGAHSGLYSSGRSNVFTSFMISNLS